MRSFCKINLLLIKYMMNIKAFKFTLFLIYFLTFILSSILLFILIVIWLQYINEWKLPWMIYIQLIALLEIIAGINLIVWYYWNFKLKDILDD